MTISTEVRKAGPFIGNDSASVFPFAFKVFKAADLIVVLRPDNIGEETTLVLDSDYHVTLNGNQDTTPGGVVTLVAGALASGFTLVVSSELPYLQPTDLTNQGGFYPKVITNALDRLTIFCQQLLEITGRTLKLPITAPTNISAEIPLPNPSELIAWNGTGTRLTTVSPQSLVTSIAYGSATADLFAGDGATTTFPLSTNPASVNNLDVSIDGHSLRPVQEGIGDYSWNGGASITFVEPPPAPTVLGDKNVLVRYMQAIPVSDSEALHAQTREALRRSYAEAGYNLVDGSFETGGTLASTSDVLLLESAGTAYAWTGAYPGGGYDVTPGIDPTVVPGFALRKNVTLRAELAAPGSTVLISGVEAGVVAVAADALKNSLAAPGSTVSIAGLEAGKVKDAANNVRAVTIITGAETKYVTAEQIGSSLLFASATAVKLPTSASLVGVTGHYHIMTMDSPVALTRIDGGKFFIRGSNVSSITIPAWSDCYVAYSAASGVYVYGLATYETIVKSYCLVNATGTGAPNELVSAALPVNVAINTRYVLTNPFGVNVPVIGWAEVYYNSKWARTGFVFSSSPTGSYGVGFNYVQGEGIIIQIGTISILGESRYAGGGHGSTSPIQSAPCRVFIQKLGA